MSKWHNPPSCAPTLGAAVLFAQGSPACLPACPSPAPDPCLCLTLFPRPNPPRSPTQQKPGNVLVNGADTPERLVAKLTDFGLSRLRNTVLVTKDPEAGTVSEASVAA